MAAARQKEMNVSRAVVATMTRGIPLPRLRAAAGLVGGAAHVRVMLI